MKINPDRGLGAYSHAFDDPSERLPSDVDMTIGQIAHRCVYSTIMFVVVGGLSAAAVAVLAGRRLWLRMKQPG